MAREHEVRVAAHALLVEVAAPLGEHLDVPSAAAVLDLDAAHHLVDHRDAVVARAAALAGVAVVAVPDRVVLEQRRVAVEGAARRLARGVLGEPCRGAAGRADAALDAALEAVLVVVHARVLEDARDPLGVAPRSGRERVVRDVRVGLSLASVIDALLGGGGDGGGLTRGDGPEELGPEVDGDVESELAGGRAAGCRAEHTSSRRAPAAGGELEEPRRCTWWRGGTCRPGRPQQPLCSVG